MKIRTKLKAGALAGNENQTIAPSGVRVKTKVKAGGLTSTNENQTLTSAGVPMRTKVKAGGLSVNENQKVVSRRSRKKTVKRS